jgi:transcriptional regulator with XRE-family HTH domain
MTEYGETLARYRIEAGLNQRELGAAIGLDSTQLNKVERGHRPPLSAKYVKPLVRALRLSRSEAKHLIIDLAGLSPKMLDFMDDGEGDEAEKEEQGSDTSTSTMVNAAKPISYSLSGTTGAKVDRLIASGHFSEEEEEEVEAVVMEIIRRFISFKETKRKTQKDK